MICRNCPPQVTGRPIDASDFRLALDEELSKLPEKYRAPLILHYLESKPATAVAKELGWPYGTVLGRMARGRDKLRARLVVGVWAWEPNRFGQRNWRDASEKAVCLRGL